jgi:hypothetical protein
MNPKISSFDRRVLFILIALEAVLFCNFYFREIAWYPPQSYDQAVFLSEAYRLEDRVLSKGVGELWNALWTTANPSGLLLPIEGAFSSLVIGGTRLPQLGVLFIAFAVLQLIAFSTAQVAWHTRAYGYMALGLILCQTTAWFWAGGLFDFRLDFIAHCLYGIWACAVIRSSLFLDRRWAIISGLLGAFLVLHRFLSMIYLFGVCAGFVVACVAVGFIARRGDLTERLKRRFYNLALSLGIVVVIVGPVLFINRNAIKDYYLVGHTEGQEKYVRASEFGIHDLADHLLFYPKSILFDHLGEAFGLGFALAIVAGLITRLLPHSVTSNARGAPLRDETILLQTIFLLGAVLGPIVVLTVDISKSPVVGGIVGAPAALLVVALTAATAANPQAPESSPGRKLIFAVSLAIFGLGFLNQFQRFSGHFSPYGQRADLEQLADLDKWLADYAAKHDWPSPAISSDVISAWFFPPALTASGYEQIRQLFEFRGLFGQGILGTGEAEALSLLAQSDFLILTTLPKVGVYPFYQRVALYWNDLKAWADKNMMLVRTVPFDSFSAAIYVRPSATVSGLSGGWITSNGMSIETERATLQQFPKIRISGPANYTWLPKIPSPLATIDAEGTSEKVVPASFRRTDNSYEILIDTSFAELPHSDKVRLHLKLDTFFVPQHLGINSDTRELVVPAPALVQLIRAGSP